MRNWNIIAPLIVSVLLLSCEEKLDQSITFKSQDLIVVEGILTNELKRHRIKLTRAVAEQNESPSPVTGATVIIFDNDENFNVLEELPAGSGEYFTDSLRAVFGKFYVLFIRHDGKEYNAFDSPPGGELLSSLTLEEEIINDEKWYKLPDQETGSIPNYVEYDIDWSMTDECQPTESCSGRVVRYDLKTVDTQETFAPEKEEFLFPQGSRIIRKKYSMSDNYQRYLRALLSETEWRGGFFDIEKDNIPTNLSDGALGFFAASTVDIDTLFINN